jgi:rfaE bifunctional protein kinase chain/domain
MNRTMGRKKSDIQQLFRSFAKQRILVIGDVMVDAYLWGRVDRISPEAPVPIVTMQSRENRLGGAANVALNVQALGATAILCSVVGNGNARVFYELMQSQALTTEGLVQSPGRPTTQKIRVLGNNHQMLRIDEESDEDITAAERKQLLDRIAGILQHNTIDAIIFEDYDKGVISRPLIERVVKMARAKNIPVTADPKQRNFHHYRDIDLLKPNLKELRQSSKLDLAASDINNIRAGALQLCKENDIRWLLVTLSERGILACAKNENHLIPAHVRNISDVSGAGDTVISVATLCLAAGCSLKLTAELSNLAGGLVCETAGVVPIEKEVLLREASQLPLA